MTKEEMIEMVNSIKNVTREKKTIYALGKELGLKMKPTNCIKCLNDYKNMIKEELGLIGDASEQSDFNEQKESVENVGEWVYVVDRPMVWNGHLIDNNTQEDIKKAFIEHFPNGYFKKIEKQDNNNTNNEE